jgi:hypothetical protein
MKTIEKRLLQAAVGFSLLAAWLLICDAGLLPARFIVMTVAGFTFHWQIFLGVAVLLVAVRDQISDLRCRCCGSHDHLSWLALVKSREVLCASCLTWDPGVAPLQAQPEYIDLFDALK